MANLYCASQCCICYIKEKHVLLITQTKWPLSTSNCFSKVMRKWALLSALRCWGSNNADWQISDQLKWTIVKEWTVWSSLKRCSGFLCYVKWGCVKYSWVVIILPAVHSTLTLENWGGILMRSSAGSYSYHRGVNFYHLKPLKSHKFQIGSKKRFFRFIYSASALMTLLYSFIFFTLPLCDCIDPFI